MDEDLLAGETGPAIVLIAPERAGAVTDALVELTGYTREELLAYPRPKLTAFTRQWSQSELRAIREYGDWRGDAVLRTKQGTLIHGHLEGRRVRGPDGDRTVLRFTPRRPVGY